MSKEQQEPFTEFAKLGRGIPKLAYSQNRTTAHVHWGDGSMWDYHEFHAALDRAGMESTIKDAWTRHRAQLNRRTVRAGGGVHGCLIYGPTPLAAEIRDIVRDHFLHALERVAIRRTYRLVEHIDGRFVVTKTNDIIEAATARGCKLVGFVDRPEVCAELQGQPILSKFLGPMWDGDAVRYEDERAFQLLSQD
jgi:hypothetical protein